MNAVGKRVAHEEPLDGSPAALERAIALLDQPKFRRHPRRIEAAIIAGAAPLIGKAGPRIADESIFR